jgi:hypothetical protein
MWGGSKLRFVATASVVAVTSLLLGAMSPRPANAVVDSAIISNGTVQLGVWEAGHLNVPGGTPSMEEGTSIVGLRYVPTNAEATADGCTCEGWGAADATTSVSGSANDDAGAPVNITVESFTHTATTAVSTVSIGSKMRVVHDYHPSSNANLYEVTVSITNISGAPIHLLYRRVMDWDIEPTAYSEYVTMVPGSAPELVYTSDGGFASADPLDPRDYEIAEGAFVDSGPDDHGALFDFDFGALNAGWTKSFKTFYGAAGTEVDALAALTAVGAQAYSLGQPSTQDGPTLGTPNTFMFGFGSVSSVPFVANPTPTPAQATPCIGGIVNSRCPNNPPEVNVTPTPVATETELAAPSATAEPPTPAPPAPTATLAGSGAAGVITGPNTGSGPDGAQLRLVWLLMAIGLLAGGAGLSAAAHSLRQR